MKIAFLVLGLFLTLACANASGTNEPPLKISIAVPLTDGQRVIECRDTNSHFHVILSNVSDTPQRIWPEDAPPGYDALAEQGRAPFVLGFPHPGESGEAVTMKAVYENVPCPAAEHHKVWVGRIASQPATYVFRRR